MKYMEQQKLTVLAWLPGDDTGCLQGELTFVENEIKSSAGTILAWATFSNQDKHLWPGQFVNVVLTLTTQKEKTVIPSQAVQMGQAGSYVFVIKPDMSVEYRPISPGARLDREIVVGKRSLARRTGCYRRSTQTHDRVPRKAGRCRR